MNALAFLVTGATGFIGGAVCQAFATVGRVRASARREISSGALGVFEFVRGDLSKDFDWTRNLKGIDVVVHCGAYVHVRNDRSASSLQKFRSVNVEGTVALARRAAELGVRRLVFLSSIGVHGAQTSGRPYRIEDKPAPHSPYAISKFEAEIALFKLARETGMEVVCIRPPLVYGPNAPGNFSTLLRALASGIPLPLGAVTQNKRSFVFVENLVSLIKCCVDHPAAANQTFIVSDDESLSTAALLHRMAKALGRPARLFSVPVPLLQMGAALLGKRSAMQRLCGSLEVDIGKTKELVGWAPPISVDEGLRRTAVHWLAMQEPHD
jgi:nucleoside-diphosphate-sugar epimerase